MTKRKPTHEAYGELQQAYDFYNRRLFGGRLPACLITFQRKNRAYGYFSGDRWQSGRTKTDEIALNPDFFKDGKRDLVELLSTLVHEMTHLEQHHYGKPGRRGYHNREWAGLMLNVGLRPYNVRDPSKMTGEGVSHTIEPEGRFAVVSKELTGGGFKLSWQDSYARPRPKPAGGANEPTPPKRPTRQKFSCPGCDLNAWAKYEAPLMCGKCKKRMRPVGLV